MEWTHRLRMRQLYLLVALYENGNVSLTAEKMGVTQPGLSKWLGELERDLNVKLFKRNARGLTPTEYCTALVGHARAIIGELDRTQATIRQMSLGSTGNLVVGTTPTVAAGVVPQAAGYFRKKFPDAFLNIIENRLDVLLPQLMQGQVDMVITRTDQARLDAGMRCDILYPEQIRIVVGASHPLARKRKVDWADVMRYPWVIPPQVSPIRRELEHELALAGQPAPRYRVETGSTVVIVTLLQDGNLVAPMSARLMAYFQGLKQLVALPLPYLREGNVGVIRRREVDESPMLKTFMEGLRLGAQN
jgi:DNA-binding transcriptional LysR family regulator